MEYCTKIMIKINFENKVKKTSLPIMPVNWGNKKETAGS